MINKITGSQPYKITDYSQRQSVEKKEHAESHKTTRADSVEIRVNQETSVTYSKVERKKPDASEIDALKAEAERTTENLRKLVEQLIQRQNDKYKTLESSQAAEDQALSLEDLGITTSDIEAAKKAISEDGEFGVKAVSDRLVNFAISVSGGDKTKLDELIAAIDEGFAAAKEILGGELPEISMKTYDETIRKLKEWAAETDA